MLNNPIQTISINYFTIIKINFQLSIKLLRIKIKLSKIKPWIIFIRLYQKFMIYWRKI